MFRVYMNTVVQITLTYEKEETEEKTGNVRQNNFSNLHDRWRFWDAAGEGGRKFPRFFRTRILLR